MSDEPLNSLKQIFTVAVKGKLRFNEFLALDDVSFNLEKGKTLGLIGRNGAGKSTTLKLISGILKPTKGSIRTYGNIVPMLELGAGFDLELTGKENIYLNGAILGYSKEYLESKYDEIVDFAEISEFVDMPIRNYSSGMMARLAFSIASVVQPEILIVDEILAVGDVAFQEKSFNRMKELMSGGATVLFVSHDLEKIEEMCDKVIWLDHGRVVMFGDTAEVCSAYKKAQGIKE
jgi:ABC-type polysaccharide/polyol phosphate transport system ATPase subunit